MRRIMDVQVAGIGTLPAQFRLCKAFVCRHLYGLYVFVLRWIFQDDNNMRIPVFGYGSGFAPVSSSSLAFAKLLTSGMNAR